MKKNFKQKTENDKANNQGIFTIYIYLTIHAGKVRHKVNFLSGAFVYNK